MISVAILAPLMGGLEYRGRMRIFNWDSTAFTSCSVLQIKVRAPTRSPWEEKGGRGREGGEGREERGERERGREREGGRGREEEEEGKREEEREVVFS